MAKSLFGFFEDQKPEAQKESENAYGKGVQEGKRGEGHVETFLDDTVGRIVPDVLRDPKHEARMAGIKQGHSERPFEALWGDQKKSSGAAQASPARSSNDCGETAGGSVAHGQISEEKSFMRFLVFAAIATTMLYFSFGEFHDWLTFEQGPAAYERQGHPFSVFFAFIGTLLGFCFVAGAFTQLSDRAGKIAKNLVVAILLWLPLVMSVLVHIVNPQETGWPPSPLWVFSACVGVLFLMIALTRLLEG